MPIDVSVVVPFFNPGANIEDCIESLLDQTLARDRFEVVLMDDGSDDGSAERVDGWAAKHPGLLTVHHLLASGGPSRPRNLGIERASGRFIQFLDSDDSLGPRALERLLEVADSSDADIVLAKVSSDFRGVYHPLFRRTVTGRTLADYPLIQNVHISKMFRRDFLLAHNIRFHEGPRYIEDSEFCVLAYANASSVAVVADTACYFYRRRRTGGRSFGDTPIVPADYFRELAAILDIIDRDVPDQPTRDSTHRRFYRGEMLGRLRGRAMAEYDEDYRRAIVDEVRALATRLSPAVHDGLPMFVRAQSNLLRRNDIEGLRSFAAILETVRLRATSTTTRWDDGTLVVGVDAELRLGDEPFRFEPESDGWLLPSGLAPAVGADDRRFSADDAADVDLDLATISRADSSVWSTTAGLSLQIESDGRCHIVGEVRLNPQTVMGGSPLPPGLWDLRLRAMIGGLTRTSPLRPDSESPTGLDAWISRGHNILIPYRTNASLNLTIDVGEWSRSLADLVEVSAETVTIKGSELLIAAPRLRGNAAVVPVGSLLLEPLGVAATPAVSCPAELHVTPDATTIRVALPQLPKAVRRWALWLRLGELGSTPARRLEVALDRGRLGRMRLA